MHVDIGTVWPITNGTNDLSTGVHVRNDIYSVNTYGVNIALPNALSNRVHPSFNKYSKCNIIY